MPSEKQHKTMDGFFEVPTQPYLYINREGLAWDDYFKAWVRPYYARNPYPELRMNGSIKPIGLHRALALTFLVCPGDPADYQVEHSDGDKTNYDLENLIWVTKSENAILAFKNGQRKDNRPVKLKDLETDEIYDFHGVNACARFLNIHPGYVSTYLKRPQAVPFRRKYVIVKEGDPMPAFTKEDIGKANFGQPKEIVVTTDSGKITIYGSTARASQNLGVTQSQIAERASKKSDVPLNGYIFRYRSDYEGDLSEAGYVRSGLSENFDKTRFVSTPRPILVNDTSIDKVERWKSVDAFANHLGLNKKTIQKSMSLNSGWYKWYRITYDS